MIVLLDSPDEEESFYFLCVKMYRFSDYVEIPKDYSVNLKHRGVCLSNKGNDTHIFLNENLTLSLSEAKILTLEFSMLKLNKRRLQQLLSILSANKRYLENVLFGFSFGFVGRIRLEGIGYKAKVDNCTLSLKLGYSHDIIVDIPSNIRISVFKDTELVLKSFSCESLGSFMARLEQYRIPNSYDNKGVVIYGKAHLRKKVKKK